MTTRFWVFIVAAAIGLAGAGWAQEDDPSACEEACFEAEDRCYDACESADDPDSCASTCQDQADRCLERCEERIAPESWGMPSLDEPKG